MQMALIVMCRTVSTEPTLRPMHVPIPIPMATVPIFATDISAINQLQLHFCCSFASFFSGLCACELLSFVVFALELELSCSTSFHSCSLRLERYLVIFLDVRVISLYLSLYSEELIMRVSS